MAEKSDEKQLTAKEKAFVIAYIGEAHFNAAEAARLAGYSERTAKQIGYENLTKPYIIQAIQPYIMSAAEVKLRLSEHSTSSLKPFLVTRRHGQPEFDLSTEEAQEKLHLIKRVKIKNKSGGSGEKSWSEEETEIEVYDAQQALAHMARIHSLFTDRTEHSGSIEFVEQAAQSLDKKLFPDVETTEAESVS